MSELSNWPSIDDFMLATDAWTEPFWAAARAHRLVVAHCARCGHARMPPTPFCPRCLSQAIEWRESAGEGRIYSYTIIRRALNPRQADRVPYAPAVIVLDDAPGVRLVSNVVDAPVDQVLIGSPVTLVWQDRADGLSVPRFQLRTGPAP